MRLDFDLVSQSLLTFPSPGPFLGSCPKPQARSSKKNLPPCPSSKCVFFTSVHSEFTTQEPNNPSGTNTIPYSSWSPLPICIHSQFNQANTYTQLIGKGGSVASGRKHCPFSLTFHHYSTVVKIRIIFPVFALFRIFSDLIEKTGIQGMRDYFKLLGKTKLHIFTFIFGRQVGGGV